MGVCVWCDDGTHTHIQLINVMLAGWLVTARPVWMCVPLCIVLHVGFIRMPPHSAFGARVLAMRSVLAMPEPTHSPHSLLAIARPRNEQFSVSL